jgi:DNA polymerase-4
VTGAGAPSRAGEPAILYLEVPDFYAEVERRDHPEIALRPVVVGGDPDKRGKVQSASHEARAAGVLPGTPMAEVLGRCPEAMLFRTNMGRYREASGALAVCLRRVVGDLERSGFSAVYVDAYRPGRTPEGLAERIAETVAREVRLPLRMGIGPTKLVARLAAEEAGGEAVRRVRGDEVEAFLAPLALARLPGVGPNTEARLRALGAERIGDLRGLPEAKLEEALGNHGRAILELASGDDQAPVRVARHPGSISRAHTLESPEPTPEELESCLRRLSISLESALAKQGLGARRVALKLRFGDQSTLTRSSTLGDAIRGAVDVLAAAETLLARMPGDAPPARVVSLTLAGLSAVGHEERQLELFAARS